MSLEEYSVESLRASLRDGVQLKYLLFWGHSAKDPRDVGKECLSQWYPTSFVVNGQLFASAEHYMMYRKAILFDDDDTAEQILRSSSPGAAKSLGRSVRGFDEQTWEEHRFDIVTEASIEKFAQSARLKDFLIGTADQVLVEASPTDAVWGIGLAASDPRACNPMEWRGLNLLGFALMVARDRLK
jgi:ribA/ribD-fused uncharacterized protein